MTMTQHDPAGIVGELTITLTGPDGEIKSREVVHNLITQVGDQFYGERAAGVAGAPAAVTGMKLGTGSTAPAKTGAGAALVTYLTNSHQALTGTPASALNGSARRITYTATWAPGKATTASPVTEVVIINDALADATSAAAATIARALVTGIAAKAAGDTLTINWTHDLLGA
jgi:hypothetical protein